MQIWTFQGNYNFNFKPMSKVKINISEKEKRRKLIDFIDDKVFNPVLNAKGDNIRKRIKKSWKKCRKKQEMK